MNRTEALELIKTIGDMYPNAYKDINNEERATRQKELMVKHLGEYEYTDVINGLHSYFDSEKGRYVPSMHDLKDWANIKKRERLARQGIKTRRIVAPEEDASNEYIEIFQTAKKRGSFTEEEERKLKRLKKYYEMFNGPHKDENYIRHFGKPREEFERLV